MIWLISQVSIHNGVIFLKAFIISYIANLLLKYKKVPVHWLLLLSCLVSVALEGIQLLGKGTMTWLMNH